MHKIDQVPYLCTKIRTQIIIKHSLYQIEKQNFDKIKEKQRKLIYRDKERDGDYTERTEILCRKLKVQPVL